MNPALASLQLRHLRLIHEIAESRQLSQAAIRLGITQPAASRRLSEIEAMIGEPLFDRLPKGMVPTPIGELMTRNAARLLGDLETIESEVDAFQKGRVGAVRVGSVTAPAIGYVVPAVQALKAESPLAEVTVDVAPSTELMKGLLRGDYDIILSRLPPDVDARLLEVMRGRVEEIRFLTRAGHPLLARKGLELADLSECRWVIQSPGAPIRHGIEQAFINRGLSVPADVLNTSSMLVMLGYMRNTDVIAAVTREVEDLVIGTNPGGWDVLDLRDEIILSPYYVVRLRNRQLNPVAHRMLDLLIKAMWTKGS